MLYMISQDERSKGSRDTLSEALDRCRELQKKMPRWATLYIDRHADKGTVRTVRSFEKEDKIK